MNPMTDLHRCGQRGNAAALEEHVQLTLTLQPAVLDQVGQLRLEWGLNSRAAVVERLLIEVLKPGGVSLQAWSSVYTCEP